MTGGYLYHRRLADRAPANGAELAFVSVPPLPFPASLATGPAWLRQPALRRAQVLVLDSIAAAPASPWLRRVDRPVVGMLHQPPGGIDGGRLRRGYQAPFDRWAYRRARLLIVASDWLAQELVHQGLRESRLRVVPPGRDLEGEPGREGRAKPSPDRRLALREGRRIAALCVANWLPRKGLAELLDALAGLSPDLVTLHLVGDAEADPRYASRLRSRLRSPELTARVVVHGVLDATRLGELYRDVDAFVLPSFEEPYGTVWGEAMAAGLPVVGWRAGNLPFLAEHEREALLLPPGDVAGLRHALERVALDEGLRRRLGDAAARRAAGRPTWDETAARFFAILREVRQG